MCLVYAMSAASGQGAVIDVWFRRETGKQSLGAGKWRRRPRQNSHYYPDPVSLLTVFTPSSAPPLCNSWHPLPSRKRLDTFVSYLNYDGCSRLIWIFGNVPRTGAFYKIYFYFTPKLFATHLFIYFLKEKKNPKEIVGRLKWHKKMKASVKIIGCMEERIEYGNVKIGGNK